MFFLIYILKSLIIIVTLLISVAYFTLAERKILGAIQRRRGPNVIGVYGLLQPLSDGLKLFAKEFIAPSSSNNFLFYLAPLLTFFLSLLSWSVTPFEVYADDSLVDFGLSSLFTFAVSSLGIYGILFSGWSSNSQYAFLGALRSASQMISYEVTLSFGLLVVVISSGSFNYAEIADSQTYSYNAIMFFPLFLIFFIAGLAETNRHPFDLPEAEAELVSGYNVEYSSMSFALFSLGEYSNILTMSYLFVCLFFGNGDASFHFFGLSHFINFNDSYFTFLDQNYIIQMIRILFEEFFFSFKICIFVLLFVWMRAVLPRYRYDQLMELGWKILTPSTLFFFFIALITALITNSQPF